MLRKRIFVILNTDKNGNYINNDLRYEYILNKIFSHQNT